MIKTILAAALVLLLAACSTTPKSPEQAIYSIQSGYNVALTLETKYASLPRCGQPASPKICSDVDVLKRLKQADIVAYNTIKSAQNTVRTPGYDTSKATFAITAAQNAVDALTNILNALGVQ